MKKRLPHCHLTLLLFAGLSAVAQGEPASLIPPFGAEGHEFNVKAKGGKTIQGWLPAGWDDNSSWADLAATYTKLKDGPKAGVPAVRIDLKDLGEGQLQLTSYSGKRVFKKGVKYAVEGWLRGTAEAKVGVRQPGEPYEFYADHDLSGGKEWKVFKFEFAFDLDRDAIIMFVLPANGSLDLAGIAVREVK